MILRPFRVEKYRKLFVENYISEYESDSFDYTRITEFSIDINQFEEIAVVTYDVFKNHYQHRNFHQEALINAIEVHEFDRPKRFSFDFRKDENVKSKLKERMSKLKEQYRVSDKDMNNIVKGIWYGYLKFKINGKHTQTIFWGSTNIDITWARELAFTQSENESSNVW